MAKDSGPLFQPYDRGIKYTPRPRRSGGIGRRARLRAWLPQGSAGSSPVSGTCRARVYVTMTWALFFRARPLDFREPKSRGTRLSLVRPNFGSNGCVIPDESGSTIYRGLLESAPRGHDRLSAAPMTP